MNQSHQEWKGPEKWGQCTNFIGKETQESLHTILANSLYVEKFYTWDKWRPTSHCSVVLTTLFLNVGPYSKVHSAHGRNLLEGTFVRCVSETFCSFGQLFYRLYHQMNIWVYKSPKHGKYPIVHQRTVPNKIWLQKTGSHCASSQSLWLRGWCVSHVTMIFFILNFNSWKEVL